MAAVTSEILNNMLRTSFTDLKSFVEVLNAELAEEGQSDGDRASHKDEISQILSSFGECEAYLKKNSTCLQEVEDKINDSNLNEKAAEPVRQSALLDEIKKIIKIITGKALSDDENRPLLNVSVNEDRINQQLNGVDDILNEFHPLKYIGDDEDEGENEEEEERICSQLEAVVQKAMGKLRNRMNDEEFASALDEEDELTDSSDEEEFDYSSLEKVHNREVESNKKAKKDMDAWLKTMWREYKQQLENVQSVDTKQLLAEALESHPDVDLQNLKHFSQFNNKVLDLFSEDSIILTGTRRSYVDPISKKEIMHPVRNTICDHIYEKNTIYGILKKKKKMRCPLLGCSCSSFTIEDLVDDDDVATKIDQSSASKRKSMEQDTEEDIENMETEDEDSGNNSSDTGTDKNEDAQIDVDNENDVTVVDSDIENADTQSQDLF